eukprot:Tamp_15614.p1 GENE.Tamp_15614~~Tamp_15614.p1  ORF type:complete len:309 (+),score=16.89 Tamp_15614:46-972(+)
MESHQSRNTDGQPQVDVKELDSLYSPERTLAMLGPWTENVNELRNRFRTNKFNHVVIPDFFNQETLGELRKSWPTSHSEYPQRYDNPFEEKQHVMNDIGMMRGTYPGVTKILEALNTSFFVDIMKNITGIDNLEADPFLHGGGIVSYPAGGSLDMHVDYRLHPHATKERRINLLIYMSSDGWKADYGGSLELWDWDPVRDEALGIYPAVGSSPLHTIVPTLNTAAIFATEDHSWHAMGRVTCPPGYERRSMNLYYVSDPRPNATERRKAYFFARPNERMDPVKQKLREIRVVRRLEEADLVDWRKFRD